MRWVAVALIAVTAGVPPHLYSQESGELAGKGRLLRAIGEDQLKRQSLDSAQGTFQGASRLLEGRDWDEFLRSEVGIAEVFYYQGKLDSAEAVLTRGLSRAEKHLSGPTIGLAEALDVHSLIHSYCNRSESAIANARRSLEIRTAINGPEDPGLASSYFTLGSALKKGGRYQESLEAFLRSSEIYRETRTQSASRAGILLAVGNLLREMGRFDEALRTFEETFTELRRQGLERTHTMALAFLYSGYCHAEGGEWKSAIGLYQEGLRLTREVEPENQSMVAGFQIQLGEVYSRMGDVEKAIDILEIGVREGRKTNRPAAMVGEVMRLAARAYLTKGEHGPATLHADSALALKKRELGPDHPDVASVHELRGEVALAAGDLIGALSEVEEALRIRSLRPGGERGGDLASLTITKGDLQRRLGRYGEAEASLRGGLASAERGTPKNPLLLSRAEEILGDLDRDRKRAEPARRRYDSAIARLFPGLDRRLPPIELMERDLWKGIPLLRILKKEGALADLHPRGKSGSPLRREDLEESLLASEILLRLRREFDSDDSKIRTLEEFEGVIEQGVRTAQRLAGSGGAEYPAVALDIMERNRTGLLLQGVRSGQLDRIEGVPDTLLQRDRRIRLLITSLELALARVLQENSPDSARAAALGRALSEQRGAFWEVRSRLREYPGYARAVVTESPFSLSRLQDWLDDSTLVLEYYLGPRDGYCVAVDRSSVRIHPLGRREGIEAAARRFLAAIRTVDMKESDAAGRELGRVLLGSFGRQLNAHSRLVVIPDRSLSRIPFEALRVPGRPGAYLLSSHEVTYALSARMFVEQHESERGGAVTFAGFAPVFADSLQAAPVPSDLLAALEEKQVRSLTPDGKKIRELKYTWGEVSGIAAEFARKGMAASTYLHSGATKEAFVAAAHRSRILHVATHGIVNEKDPRLSALLFAAGDDPEGKEGGVFYAPELANLSLSADLAVLSCCDGGVGEYIPGEGLNALARAFLLAGARSVAYSLWKVMDRESSGLMLGFYQAMLKGESYGGALRRAKLAMIARPSTAAPYHWAGFVLTGDGSVGPSLHKEFSHVKELSLPEDLPVVETRRE